MPAPFTPEAIEKANARAVGACEAVLGLAHKLAARETIDLTVELIKAVNDVETFLFAFRISVLNKYHDEMAAEAKEN